MIWGHDGMRRRIRWSLLKQINHDGMSLLNEIAPVVYKYG